MHFESMIAVLVLLTSCGTGDKSAFPVIGQGQKSSKVDLGDHPTSAASALTTSAVTADSVVFLDSYAHAVRQFQLSTLGLKTSWSLRDLPNTNAIYVGEGGEYVIGLSDSDFAVQGLNGYQRNLLRMAGSKIESFAFPFCKKLTIATELIFSFSVALFKTLSFGCICNVAQSFTSHVCIGNPSYPRAWRSWCRWSSNGRRRKDPAGQSHIGRRNSKSFNYFPTITVHHTPKFSWLLVDCAPTPPNFGATNRFKPCSKLLHPPHASGHQRGGDYGRV